MKLGSTRKSGVVLIVTFGLLITACGSSAKRQAANVLDTLQKIQAALKVKVSYEDYSQLVTEAQFQFDKSSLSNGELKNELTAALDAYKEAKWAWELSRKVPTANGRDSFILVAGNQDVETMSYERKHQTKAKELLKKYSLISGTESDLALILISTDDVLQAIWKTAHQHVEKAKSLNS